MSTVDQELKAFCEGYLESAKANDGLIRYADDWVVWRDYDINLTGCEYVGGITDRELRVSAYPAGWKDSLPNPLYQFTVGE